MDPLKLTCSQQLWLHSSVGRALHRYRRGHGFESRWSLNSFFRLLFRNCLNCVSTAKIIHNVIKSIVLSPDKLQFVSSILKTLTYAVLVVDIFHILHSQALFVIELLLLCLYKSRNKSIRIVQIQRRVRKLNIYCTAVMLVFLRKTIFCISEWAKCAVESAEVDAVCFCLLLWGGRMEFRKSILTISKHQVCFFNIKMYWF